MTTHRQSIHSIHNKKFWTEFFYLYESLPALWDMNNPLYKNRQVKCDAYDIMVDKLCEIEPNADREDVLRKINIFRTNYRRECSRINMSIQEGRHYQSTLWYFDLLCFLQTADTRRDRKRKLDDDGEKSIMRKRRSNQLHKSSDQFIITTKKEHLIEYPTHSNTHDFEYDLEEEPDYDYVADELAHALVDGKSDTNSEIQSNSLEPHKYQAVVDEENDGEEDGESQHEYHNDNQDEYQNYTLQRNIQTNNPKIQLTADNVAQLTGEIISAEASIEINDESQEQQVFHEYTAANAGNENESIQTTGQWCIKTTNSQNIATLHLQKPELHNDTSTTTANNATKPNEIKFVRDVKTMTSSNSSSSLNCCHKISVSSEILAKSWAVQYDELTPDQKLLARKAINDILFEGCMGHLALVSNGRVTIDEDDYKNVTNVPKNIVVATNKEVESGEIYEQCTNLASSSSSVSGVGIGAAVTVTASVASTPKVHATDEWLKL
ncbi:uncharacterized protein LOC111685592 isoform X1 [Lucilia cuprina]|uniref:uncharacterized protein LOC111685592 isoform X1 n=1 Tax=Lucilia cuprina TaxID=7375 RepID=UPI001F064022|nr:uncharacterized protein LOC111685592 isoform X1 [Lucilia cuprina]